jgi:hypothetical protein
MESFWHSFVIWDLTFDIFCWTNLASDYRRLFDEKNGSFSIDYDSDPLSVGLFRLRS